MHSRKASILTLILLVFTTVSFSQSLSTFSPYSRYGLGEIRSRGYANTRALGGLSQGIRNGAWINYLNPASYTAQDSMSFIFDFGLDGGLVNYSSQGQSNLNPTANLNHIAIQFPLTKWMGASAGIQPYSDVGYRIKHIEMDPYLLSDIGPIKYYHNGTGGLTQVFLGLAVEPVKNLSLGANISYFMGSMEHTKTIEFPEYATTYVGTHELNSIVVRDFAFSFGIQYSLLLGKEKDYKIILGATLDNETSLKANHVRFITPLGYSDTILFQDNIQTSKILIPSNYSGGFTFGYKENLLIGAEYAFQDWTKAKFYDGNNLLAASKSIRAGVQITPDPQHLRDYFKRVSYRVGGYYSETYLKLADHQIKDYGITFGLGLPLRRTRSTFNVAVELGTKGTTDNGLVREDYAIINFGFTFYDFWFMKRKIN